MRRQKKDPNKPTDITVEIKPSTFTLALIRQFAKCFYVERDLRIPDNTFFIN